MLVKTFGSVFLFTSITSLAFDRVPREMIRWAMRKLGVEQWLVSAVMSMCTGAKTVEQFMVIVKVLR